jgi:hypothetical protein
VPATTRLLLQYQIIVAKEMAAMPYSKDVANSLGPAGSQLSFITSGRELHFSQAPNYHP